MSYLISYAFHMLVSVLFFLLIPFPFLIKGSLLDEPGRFQLLLKIYKKVIWAAHGGVVIAIVSGFLMTTQWFTIWFMIVVLIWLALSAFLGMTAKMVRVILERLGGNQDAKDEIAKLRLYSFLLMISILSMFLMKIVMYI
ncbi:hypothetical protein [Halalkalibacter krulwichiae]|uniref:DUF2269 family protein n=1 Tax=Halalkalibacter krulwichiae TaxID=199441 RepID=A0A1X9MBV8_9BACI|nr:hypothetical protein [Halalkalibacter krulwichiae]ARK30896.1 hypothetical protein BkAM31D_14195 [Halalkalibacter krulwichiae]